MRKSETRNPTAERNPNAEIQAEDPRLGDSGLGLLSDFGFRISSLCVTIALCLLHAHASNPSASNECTQITVIIVVGAAGEAEFGTNFVRQATLWQAACKKADARATVIGLDSPSASTRDLQVSDHDQLQRALASESKEALGQLWLVLIGHGTFDGKEARFNLRGPDLSATELALWLKPFRRPLAVINTASASAPFLNKLSGAKRVIITATRSGHEQNFTRFGQYFAEALTNLQADLDKDGQVSLLEAFLMASRQAVEFYKIEGRLATEHALLDDNGDGLGTPAEWFRGLRAFKKPKEDTVVDGLLAHQFHLIRTDAEANLNAEQRARRDALERAVLLHREKKSQLPEEDYYRELEKLLLDLARFYEANRSITNH